MTQETKSELKQTIATGASSAAGAVAGVVIGAALTMDSVDDADVVIPVEPDDEPITEPQHSSTAPMAHNTTSEHHTMPITPVDNNKDDAEVLDYERVTYDDGSTVDVAVVREDGEDVVYIDADLDGEADLRVIDANHDGALDQNEMEVIMGDGVDMQAYADAAGFNPQFAQNDLPDYVNDADVNTYMA